MTLLQINANGQQAHGLCGAATAQVLRPPLAALPPGAPVVILIHGFKFTPQMPHCDPHDHILSHGPTTDCPRAVSWPRHLGFTRPDANQGLCIAFGWHATGSIFRAVRQSHSAAIALAGLIDTIRRIDPARPLHIFTHSLGARVALAALPALPEHSVDRIILLAAAAFDDESQAAMASPAGRTAEVFNITSRENDLFDLMFQGCFLRRGLGHGLSQARANWIDIQIDKPQTRAALAALGFPTRAPKKRICHWSGYLRPGLFRLYRKLLLAPQDLGLSDLRCVLPRRSDPFLSRLVPSLLPLHRKTSS